MIVKIVCETFGVDFLATYILLELMYLLNAMVCSPFYI